MIWFLSIWFVSAFVVVFAVLYYALRMAFRKYERIYLMMRVRA